MMNRQSATIVSLATVLSVVLVWFVVIDNYVVPSIQQQISDAFESGYAQGAQIP